MISDADKNKLLDIAKRYKVSMLYLFGSNLDPSRDAKDIDLAVDGIPDKLFFEFYRELILGLSKPVDLIDLNRKSAFNDMIRSKATLLYG